MGACCSTENYEESLEQFFKKIPINNKSMTEIYDLIYQQGYDDSIVKLIKNSKKIDLFLDKLTSGNFLPSLNVSKYTYIKEKNFVTILPETNFQNFIYSNLLVSTYEKESFAYFTSVYKSIEYNIRYPIMKLLLILIFGKFDKSYSEKFIIESISYFSVYMTTLHDINEVANKSHFYINTHYLFLFLKYYIKSISIDTVNSLMKALLKQNYSKEVYDKYNDLWNEKIIEDFIGKTFFKIEDNKAVSKNIEKFVKENLTLLVSPQTLRKQLTDYAELRIDDFIEEKNRLIYSTPYNFN